MRVLILLDSAEDQELRVGIPRSGDEIVRAHTLCGAGHLGTIEVQDLVLALSGEPIS